MTKEPLREEGGYILIPDSPGIGIELADDISENFRLNREAFLLRPHLTDLYMMYKSD